MQQSLQELTGEVTQRPLHAWVATSNVASIRVLEKCGFVRVGSQTNNVEELLFELLDSPFTRGDAVVDRRELVSWLRNAGSCWARRSNGVAETRRS